MRRTCKHAFSHQGWRAEQFAQYVQNIKVLPYILSAFRVCCGVSNNTFTLQLGIPQCYCPKLSFPVAFGQISSSTQRLMQKVIWQHFCQLRSK